MSGESDSDDLFQQHVELQNQQTNSIINVKPYSNAQPGYSVPKHQSVVSYSMDANSMVHVQKKEPISNKVYCIIGYKIIVHLLLIYCVLGVTYLLSIDYLTATTPFKTEPLITTTAAPISTTNHTINSIQTSLSEMKTRITEVEDAISFVNTSHIEDIDTLFTLIRRINDSLTAKYWPHAITTPAPITSTYDIGAIQTFLFEIQARTTEVENDIHTMNQSHIADINSLNDKMNQSIAARNSDIESLFSTMRIINASVSARKTTALPSNNSVSTYDMKYVVFNGKDCNIAGVFGAACVIYSSAGVLEVIRETTGTYKVYWNDPYPHNDYVVVASSNGEQHNGAFAAVGGSDDVFNNYGVSRYFISVQTRSLGSSSANTDSDYITVVAQPAFGLNYVTFYGDKCSGSGQYGTTCTELMSKGILEVVTLDVVDGTQNDYRIYFTNPVSSSNYLILACSNVQGTNGAITNIRGNNDGNGITQNWVSVDSRAMNTNVNQASDYVSVVMGIPEMTASYPDMKWVAFDGTDCNGAGVYGITCTVFGNMGILEVVREGTGIYKIYWNQGFANNTYALLCNSNVQGTGGTVCIIGGNNDATTSYYGISTQFASIQTREMASNNKRDSNYIAVLVF